MNEGTIFTIYQEFSSYLCWIYTEQCSAMYWIYRPWGHLYFVLHSSQPCLILQSLSFVCWMNIAQDSTQVFLLNNSEDPFDLQYTCSVYYCALSFTFTEECKKVHSHTTVWKVYVIIHNFPISPILRKKIKLVYVFFLPVGRNNSTYTFSSYLKRQHRFLNQRYGMAARLIADRTPSSLNFVVPGSLAQLWHRKVILEELLSKTLDLNACRKSSIFIYERDSDLYG